MALSESHLLGWLCFIRISFGVDQVPPIPRVVREGLVEKGWIVIHEESGDGYDVSVTDDGVTQSDLVGPEWGITLEMYT